MDIYKVRELVADLEGVEAMDGSRKDGWNAQKAAALYALRQMHLMEEAQRTEAEEDREARREAMESCTDCF